MSIFRFIRWIAEGEPITLFGDGSQQRDFSFVEDIARGTVAALQPLGYETINLGGDRPIALTTIIGELERLLGKKANITYRPAHPADVPATWANIDQAKKLLHWQPTISVEEGLARCVAWYQENRELALGLSLGEI